MSARRAVAVWTLALLVTAGAIFLVATSDHEESPLLTGALAISVGLAFIGAGLLAAAQRPENATGNLMILVGFSWFIGALTEANQSLPFTIGLALGSLNFGFFAWLVLAFPSGRLERTVDRALVAATFLLVAVAQPAHLLFEDHREGCPECPANALLVAENDTAGEAIEVVFLLSSLVVIVAIAGVLVVRWRAATKPLRRALTPVFLAAGFTILVIAASLVLEGVTGAGGVFNWLILAALLTVPLAFLLGLLRARLARSAVGRLVVELGNVHGPGELRESLARALRDPSLEVAYSLNDDTWIDAEGGRIELPAPGSRRSATLVEHEGRPVAALLHDPSIRDDAELIEAVSAAAALSLQNERRLQALAASERRTRALLEAMPDNMFRVARDGSYRDANIKDERYLPVPAAALSQKRVQDVLPQPVAELIMGAVERALATGDVQTVEYRMQRPLGLRDSEARIVASGEDEAVIIVRDVTERRRQEQELRRLYAELEARHAELERERDFLRAVANTTPSLLSVIDHEGQIVRFNRAAEQTSGRRDDEQTRGRKFWDVFVAAEECDDFARRIHETGVEHENTLVTTSGERRSIAWWSTPIEDEEGRERYLLCAVDVTERKRQEEELRSSRARIVEAADLARRRLERNLHDGAQQRLVSLSISLRLAESRIATDPNGAQRLLGAAREELARALDELRELARGIHPAVLTDRGLAAALETLVARSPVPVELETPAEPLPEPVEAAAYYVVSEALANVAKYAQASEVTVRVARRNGRAIVEVCDDGVGGADPARGSGLRGLADRIAALDGTLDVASAAGEGTRITAEIPAADAAG